MKPAKGEQLGFRDERISQFHRELGYDYPAVDVDFCLCEYDKGKPVALIEHKHENYKAPDGVVPSFSAIRALADAAQIPFFLVKYNDTLTSFEVTGMNLVALKKWKEKFALSRNVYARFLESLRSRKDETGN